MRTPPPERSRMAKKSANPVDKHFGSRVRMRRMMLAMSQTDLGDALGLTFQQVQKYEKGTNRVGASRIQHISQILQVPVAFFFEGAPHQPGQPKGLGDAMRRSRGAPTRDAAQNPQPAPASAGESLLCGMFYSP